MHSSRIRTARSLTAPPRTPRYHVCPPCHACPLPHMHTCPPITHTPARPPAIHAPHHAYPPPCTPPATHAPPPPPHLIDFQGFMVAIMQCSKKNIKQECIPVGCVLAAHWLLPGPGGVPGPRGCTLSRGCTWSRWYLVPGVYLVWGDTWSQGVYLVRGWGNLADTPPPRDQTRYPPGTRPGTPPGPDKVAPRDQTRYPLWTEWMTDRCKNITLATTS